MKRIHVSFPILLTLIILLMTTGCREDEKQESENILKIRFDHKINGSPLITDSMMYTNAAGNDYEISEIMYFISDIQLYKQDGTIIKPENWDEIHYTDTEMPITFEWLAGNKIPAGTYDSLTFTFGIIEEKNISFLFVNPPEVNMAWPEVLGGGYHYLMLNGWWKDTEGIRKPFNFHIGIGQIYENNSGQVEDITGFVQNAFTVNPGGGSFTFGQGLTLNATLTMNIESWFDTPVVFDFFHFGGSIMQNQEAMHTACLNGKDVFSLSWE